MKKLIFSFFLRTPSKMNSPQRKKRTMRKRSVTLTMIKRGRSLVLRVLQRRRGGREDQEDPESGTLCRSGEQQRTRNDGYSEAPNHAPTPMHNETPPAPSVTSFLSRMERFFHVENVHYPGQGEEVKGALNLYSRVCGKKSMTPSDLTQHNRVHHPDHLRFTCDLCPGKKFVNQTQLDAHKVIHRSKRGEDPTSVSFVPQG